MVTIEDLKHAAIYLGDADNINLEYNRAMCELIGEFDGKEDMPPDIRAQEIADELGFKINP